MDAWHIEWLWLQHRLSHCISSTATAVVLREKGPLSEPSTAHPSETDLLIGPEERGGGGEKQSSTEDKLKSRMGRHQQFLPLLWQRVHVRTCVTSMEIRRWTRFLRQTPVGDCTSSEDVPDAWSLSPSEPIFRFSCTISKTEWEWLEIRL